MQNDKEEAINYFLIFKFILTNVGDDVFVECKKYFKTFGSKQVLHEVNLKVTSGEFFGLLGANGAGKTTLIRLISTLLLPTKGEIELDGQRLSRAKIDLKSQITTVTQEYSLRNDMTVLEVMELQGRLYHMKSKLRKQGSETLLKKCGLWEYRNQNTRQLSGGYKLLLMLCRALLPNPKIVLLDEPTVGLDPFARRMMWQMIRDLHHQGLTFILTTHYMEEAQMLCHRVAFMRKGCVLG